MLGRKSVEPIEDLPNLTSSRHRSCLPRTDTLEKHLRVLELSLEGRKVAFKVRRRALQLLMFDRERMNRPNGFLHFECDTLSLVSHEARNDAQEAHRQETAASPRVVFLNLFQSLLELAITPHDSRLVLGS